MTSDKDKKVPPRGKPEKQVRYYDPPNILKQKVGTGGIEPLRLQRAEEFIDNNTIDILPYAKDILHKLEKRIREAKRKDKVDREVIETITGPIMELKANGAMFGYRLMTEIAEVILNFLENIDELNEDAFDVVDVHQRTLAAIIEHELAGDGSAEGRALAHELHSACNRYRRKYSVVIEF